MTALLQAGANLEARDEYSGTPLHRAAELSKNPAVIKVMLDAGADTAARNAAGKTPWDLVQVNDALKGSDAYWRLNDARFKSSDSVFSVSGDVSAPRLTYKIEPEYSEEARKAKHQGTVVLAIEVWEDGRAHNIRVIRSPSGSGWTKRRSRRSRNGSSCPARKTGFQSRSPPTSKLTFEYKSLLVRVLMSLSLSGEHGRIGVTSRNGNNRTLSDSRRLGKRRVGVNPSLRDRSFENQRYRASGLNLVVAAIVLWNTAYLERVVQALRDIGNGGRQPPAPSVATGLGAHQPDGRLQLAAEQAS